MVYIAFQNSVITHAKHIYLDSVFLSFHCHILSLSYILRVSSDLFVGYFSIGSLLSKQDKVVLFSLKLSKFFFMNSLDCQSYQGQRFQEQ